MRACASVRQLLHLSQPWLLPAQPTAPHTKPLNQTEHVKTTQSFGKALETYFLPALVALGVVIGGFAARSYSGPEGASAFIKP